MKNKPTLRGLLKKKEVEFGKEVQLEKNDFLALMIAAASVFVPVIVLIGLFFGLIIWLFIQFGLLVAVIAFFVLLVATGAIIRYKNERY